MGNRGKKVKTSLPEVPWSENKHSRVWSLISEMSKSENYKVLFGKKDKGENTVGDRKTTAHKRIGAVVLPDYYKVDPTVAGERIKGKIESLTRTYKRHAVKLRTTGGGLLREDGDHSESDDDEFCNFYIGVDGPNDETPDVARNIWEKIKQDFIFFPELHRIFAARPNVTPIAVTTGVGPSGKRTLHMQAPSDDEGPSFPNDFQIGQIRTLQDALRLESARRGAISPPLDDTADKENENTDISLTDPIATPSQKVTSKPSSFSQDSINKAKSRIQKVPPKRTINDTLLEIQTANLNAINARARDEMILKKRGLLLEEFKAGIWDAAQDRVQLARLEEVDPEPLPKRARHESPDWDTSFGDDDAFSV